MGKRIVHLSAALAVLLYAPPLRAAGPELDASMLSGVKWIRFDIVGGRLAFRGEGCTQHRLQAESPEGAKVRESLTARLMPHHLYLRYERGDDQSQFLLEADERGQLSLWHSRSGAAAGEVREVRYFQPASGKLQLTLAADKPRTIVADDLWQLLLSERDARRHLVPLLTAIRPDWDLDSRLNATERLLVAQAADEVVADRRQWQEWLDEMTSPRFAQRQAADVALRQCGQPVLGFLRQAEARGQLDAEQRRRVRSILAELPDGRADCPHRVADWLAADRRVWLAVLSRGDLEQRIAAAEHLSRLCQRPVPFDPAAEVSERDAQLAALAALLADH